MKEQELHEGGGEKKYNVLEVFIYVKGYSMAGEFSLFFISKDIQVVADLNCRKKKQIVSLGKTLSWKGSQAIELLARRTGKYPPLRVFKSSLILPQLEKWI